MYGVDRQRFSGSDEREAREADAAALDFGALARGIWRKRLWIGVFTLTGFLVGLAFVSVTKPRYTSEAKVFLERNEDYFTRPSKQTGPDQLPLLDPEAVESQVQLVTSRDLARQAVEKLGLSGNPEFDPLANGMSPLTRLLVILGIQRDPREIAAQDRILDTYFSRLLVYPVAKTRVLSIEFSSWDPDLAARGANTVAQLYLQMQQDARKTVAKSAGAWLEPNIQALRDKVADAESKVEAFRAQSGLLVGNNNVPITTQQLADLTTEMTAARGAESAAEAKAKLIRDLLRQGRVAELSEVANNELIRGIAQQSVTLRGQLALESRTLLPGHPRIQELSAQIANVDAALRTAAAKVAAGLENDARLARSRVEALKASLKDQQQTVATDNGEQVRLRALERDATAARDQLESLLAKDREAKVRNTGDVPAADGRVISAATAPELPSFPKKVPTLVIGTLAGFLLSLGLVTTRELLAGPSRPAVPARTLATAVLEHRPAPAKLAADPAPVARPIVESESESAHDFDRDDAHDGDASLEHEPMPVRHAVAETEEAALLAESIAREKPEVHGSCVLVCALGGGADVGSAALTLGRSLARKGHALLIDIHGGGHAFKHVIDLKDGYGLTDLLHEGKTFDDVIYRDFASSLHILPIGRNPQGVGQDEERLNLVIDALIAAYDYVVFEGPALEDSDASLDLAAWTDVSVLVSPEPADSEDVNIALDMLEEAGAVNVRLMADASPSTVDDDDDLRAVA